MNNAEILRELRYKLEMTQTEFGAIIGLTQKKISEWEIGVYKINNLKLLGIICFFRSRATRNAKIWPFLEEIKERIIDNIS